MTGTKDGVSGDARIARAFRRSLVVLAVLALAVVVAVYINRLMQGEPAPVAEQVIQGPALPAAPVQVQPPTVRFVDVTEAAGIDFVHANGATGEKLLPETMGSGVAVFDYDGDGDPDVFITAVGENRLYRNDAGRFVDVTEAAGVGGDPQEWSTGAAFFDYDGDGDLDLFVANDTVQNFLFHNRGDGTFEEVGTLAGLAFDRNGGATGAMGTDVAHFRNDAELGIAVGNFANEMTSLYVSQGDPLLYADEAIGEGIGPATRLALTFGLFFFDFDLDGRLDLFQTNGHLEEDINLVQSSQHYAQPAQLFWNCGIDCPAGFVAIDDAGAIATPMVGRGAAYGDLDGDGDLDIVVTQVGRRPLVLRNDRGGAHGWLRVRLAGRAPNADAIGATVEVEAGGVRQRRQVMPTRSYLSQVELPVTFGLGPADRVDTVRVRWPNGQTQEIHDVQPNQSLVVEQAGPS